MLRQIPEYSYNKTNQNKTKRNESKRNNSIYFDHANPQGQGSYVLFNKRAGVFY
jgi:hypothetical protein